MTDAPHPDAKWPRLLCHRGAHADRPENTMPAFQRAAELGASGIEFDVRTSRDGHLFILHDPILDRTTNGSGPASDLTFDELRRLDAGSWFDPQYANARIAVPGEVMRWAGDRMVVLLDLKEQGPNFERKVAAEIRAHGNPDKVIIGVRTPDQARSFRASIPECRQLAFMRSPDLIEEFVRAETEILRLWLHWITADPGLVDVARATGKELLTNGTRGDVEEARILAHIAPDWLLIDDIAQLTRSIARINEGGPAPPPPE